MKLLILGNPAANSGRSDGLRQPINDALITAGFTVDWLQVSSADEAQDLIARYSSDNVDLLVAAGGDGTVFCAVNGLMRRPESKRWPLAVLPIGTGNAFARDLGLLPGDWEQGIDLIIKAYQRRVDVAEVTGSFPTFWFINILGTGFVVDAALMAKRFKGLGRRAYTVGTLLALLRLKSQALRVRFGPAPTAVDGLAESEQEGADDFLAQDNLFIEVSNSRYTGTHFLMAPEARLDDGKLDVTLVRRLPRWRLLKLFPTIFDGSHTQFEEVTSRQAEVIHLEEPAGMTATVDGEFVGQTPMTIQCLKGALSVISAR